MSTPVDHSHHRDLRLGTLVRGGEAATAIAGLLPHGFESFQVFFWQDLGGAELPRLAADCRAALGGSGAVISSLGVFGNPLERDEAAERNRAAWRSAIVHAHEFGCDLVCGFTGRERGRPIPECMPRFAEVWAPLAELAAQHGVRLAFENCSMGGTWGAGDWNLAHNPDAWELMFQALDAPHLGLEWEPCHQVVQLIDPLPQLDDWAARIFHLHGKDATVDHARLRHHGYHGAKPWCWHRHPGFGDTDWRRVIDLLRLHGFHGAIDIEGWHDPVYRGDLELTGQVRALRHLQDCRGGAYIAG